MAQNNYEQQSSTPLINAASANSPNLKSHSFKQFNHSRLRQNCSPYSTNHHNNVYAHHTNAVNNAIPQPSNFFNFQQQHLQINQTTLSNISSPSSKSSYNNQNYPRLQRDLEVYYSDFSSESSSQHNRQLLQFNDSSSENTSANNGNSSDLINVSLRTNPPTTPVSTSMSGSLNETSASPSSIALCNLLKKQDLKSSSSVSVVTSSAASSTSQMPPPRPLYVTPATNSSPSNTDTSASSSVSNAHQHAVISSMQTNYSRSSSVTSLGSYADCFKSGAINSDVQSEYSSAGFMTPACYSDLPDSPGDSQSTLINKFNANKAMKQQMQLHQEQMYMFNQQQQHQHNSNYSTLRFNQHQPTLDELSYITVDTSASKSNDITIIERTVLCPASNFSTLTRSHNSGGHSQNQPNFQRSENSSSESSQSNSFLINPNNQHVIQKPANNTISNAAQCNAGECGVENDDDDGSVRRYCVNEEDPEMWSDTRSVRSNVSALSFPNEPASVDLTLMKSLLASSSSRKHSSSASNQNSMENKPMPFMSSFDWKQPSAQQEHPFQKKPAWATSNTPLSSNINPNPNMFTPPVKFINTENNTYAMPAFFNPFQMLSQVSFFNRIL